MTIISDNNKIEFYKFLNGDKSVAEFEQFIYSQPGLEQQLNHETYLELIGFDFKHGYDRAKLSDLIKKNIIEEGQYETWKLKAVLTNFLADPKNLHIHLDKLYHLYCGVYQDNGQRKYEFKFLANLGLNYLYWIDEGYLKTKNTTTAPTTAQISKCNKQVWLIVSICANPNNPCHPCSHFPRRETICRRT